MASPVSIEYFPQHLNSLQDKLPCHTTVNRIGQVPSFPTLRKSHNGGWKSQHGNANKLLTLCREDRLKEGLELFNAIMGTLDIWEDSDIFACLLQTCANMGSLTEGKQVHAHMLKLGGSKQNCYLDVKLVIMYARCCCLNDARLVFNRRRKKNVLLWTVMIGVYAGGGQFEEALKLFDEMRQLGFRPDGFVIPSVLKACAGISDLKKGRKIHEYIVRTGIESDVFVYNALVDMYSKCRNLEAARQVFDEMPQRDMVSWNAMIAGYAQNGQADKALEMLGRMDSEGVKPNVTSWNAVIAGFSQQPWEDGVKKALEVFWRMQLAGMEPTVISWNLVIGVCAERGLGYLALKFLREMQLNWLKPNLVTVASVLLACANLSSLGHGKEIHGYIIRNRLEADVVVGSALVDMYVKCGSLEYAHRVFDKISQRNAVSWNSMTAG